MIKRIFSLVFFLSLMYSASLEAKDLFSFEGEIDFPKKETWVTINPGSNDLLSIRVAQASKDLYQMVISAEDLTTPFFDISTTLETTWEFIHKTPEKLDAFSGKVESKYTLINHKPVREVVGQFTIKNGTVILGPLSLGSVVCKGSIQVIAPFRLNLLFQLSEIDLYDFISFFAGPKDILAEGEVSGDIRVSGQPDKLYLAGRLFSYGGFVKTLAYDSMVFNAEGAYPSILITDSTIINADGVPFNVTGRIDLSDKENLTSQIKALNVDPLVKSDGSNVEWTLKRIQLEDEAGTTEFKYLLREGNESGGAFEEDSDMLGIERKMEF